LSKKSEYRQELLKSFKEEFELLCRELFHEVIPSSPPYSEANKQELEDLKVYVFNVYERLTDPAYQSQKITILKELKKLMHSLVIIGKYWKPEFKSSDNEAKINLRVRTCPYLHECEEVPHQFAIVFRCSPEKTNEV
jgi:hypothetical protein